MFTHIGDACRAAGFLPIAMPFSVRNFDRRRRPRAFPSPDSVESTTRAVAVGAGGSCCRRLSHLSVPHSPPWLRFQSPLIEPDMQISCIRLSDEIMPSPTENSSYAAKGA